MAVQERKGRPFHGWRMVALAFVSYNAGLTVVINAYGPALPVIQRDLGLTRAAASLPFGALMLAIGLLAPLIGTLAGRYRLRTLMIAGAFAHALGFGLLSFATTLPEMLVLFGLLIGSGACLMAVITAPALIGRWFVRDRGKALGLGLVQVMGIVAAPAAAWLIATGGSRLLFLSLALFFLALVPLLRLIVDRPEDIGQSPRLSATTPAQLMPIGSGTTLPVRAIFADPAFWLISLAIGIATAAGTTFTAHAPAMALARGLTPSIAATMLSSCGVGALAGAILYGWLIDRLGPFPALFLVLVQAAVTWLLFSLAASTAALIALAGLLGAAMGPAITMHSACIGHRYDAASFTRVIGYSYLTKIPFLFGAAPLAGWLYDRSHGYGSTYAMLIVGLTIAAGAALALIATDRAALRKATAAIPG